LTLNIGCICAAHAVIVSGKIIRHETRADNDHRVGLGGPAGTRPPYGYARRKWVAQ